MIENSHRKGQMLRVASEEKFLLSPKGSIGAIYVKNGRTNISVIKNARCARVTAWGRPRDTEDKRDRSMPSHSVLENNHYKLQPLRITTSIFKITKMSLEKGAVSCPRSKLLRRRPKAGTPQYSTSCAVRSPWNTLKTQVITVHLASRHPVNQALKAPPLESYHTRAKAAQTELNSSKVETASLLAAMNERAKDAPENPMACSRRQTHWCKWALTSSEQHRKS